MTELEIVCHKESVDYVKIIQEEENRELANRTSETECLVATRSFTSYSNTGQFTIPKDCKLDINVEDLEQPIIHVKISDNQENVDFTKWTFYGDDGVNDFENWIDEYDIKVVHRTPRESSTF